MPGHFIPIHNVRHSAEAKRKMSDAKKLLVGELSPRFRAKLSEETKKKIGLARIGKSSWNKGIYGVVKASKETKKKMSIVKCGEKNNMFGKKAELCPAWRGGTSPLRELIEGSWQYKKWRKDVFHRDNYKCITCGGNGNGKRGGYHSIHAHHNISLAKIISKNYDLLEAGNYDIPELLDINNGITLCMECHLGLHTGEKIRNVA